MSAAHDNRPLVALQFTVHEEPSSRNDWCWPQGSTASTAAAAVYASALPPGTSIFIGTDQELVKLSISSGCFTRISAGHGSYATGAVAAGRLSNGQLLIGVRNASSSTGSSSILMVDSATPPRTLGRWPLPSVAELSDLVRDSAGSDVYALDSSTSGFLRLSRDLVPWFAPEYAGPSGSGKGSKLTSKPAERSKVSSSLGEFSGGRSKLRLHTVRQYATSPVVTSTGAAAAHAAQPSGMLLAFGYAWIVNSNNRRNNRPATAQEANMSFVEIKSGAVLPASSFSVALGAAGCRNPCFYRGDVLYLDSSVGGLGRLLPNGTATLLWSAGAGCTSSGMAIIDDVAFIGLACMRQSRVQLANHAARARDFELAALDVRNIAVLWRMPLPARLGNINSVAAPGLAAHGCTWRACTTWSKQDDPMHMPTPERWAPLLRVGQTFTWHLFPSANNPVKDY